MASLPNIFATDPPSGPAPLVLFDVDSSDGTEPDATARRPLFRREGLTSLEGEDHWLTAVLASMSDDPAAADRPVHRRRHRRATAPRSLRDGRRLFARP
jgi:hypothetical protein